MISNLLESTKLFLASIIMSYRHSACVAIIPDPFTYQYAFGSYGRQYEVNVTRRKITIDYPQWFIPNFKKYIYKATIVEKVEGITCKTFSDFYPQVSLDGRLDKEYPFICISRIHIQRYFEL